MFHIVGITADHGAAPLTLDIDVTSGRARWADNDSPLSWFIEPSPRYTVLQM